MLQWGKKLAIRPAVYSGVVATANVYGELLEDYGIKNIQLGEPTLNLAVRTLASLPVNFLHLQAQIWDRAMSFLGAGNLAHSEALLRHSQMGDRIFVALGLAIPVGVALYLLDRTINKVVG